MHVADELPERDGEAGAHGRSEPVEGKVSVGASGKGLDGLSHQ